MDYLPQFEQYIEKFTSALKGYDWSQVSKLADAMMDAWQNDRQVFVCGNGGSAANAVHWSNDYIYPICKTGGKGIRITSLPANVATLTCIGNDVSYDEIYSRQLETFGKEGDILIAMSGSGNSPNIVRALEKARELKMKSFAILGYDGGKCLKLADVPLHLEVDMQMAEDFQMVICHLVMQALAKQKAKS